VLSFEKVKKKRIGRKEENRLIGVVSAGSEGIFGKTTNRCRRGVLEGHDPQELK